MTNSFDLEFLKVTVILNREARARFRIYRPVVLWFKVSGEELELVVNRPLVLPELTRIADSLGLELAKVTVILNEKAQKYSSGL